MSVNVRKDALLTLVKCSKEGTYLSAEISKMLKNESYSEKDRAFFSALVNGTIRQKTAIDFYLGSFIKKDFNKLSLVLQNILRIGAFQILYLDKVPDSAAVNESVKLATSMLSKGIAGLVNGVLRNISRNKDSLPLPKTEKDRLSVKYSVPTYVLDIFTESYGLEKTSEFLSRTKGRDCLRINKKLCDFEALSDKLAEDGVNIEKAPLSNAAFIDINCDISSLSAYREGLFHIEDLSSQICCAVLDADLNDVILDVCAAPGGKTLTLAQSAKQVYSCDIHIHRTELIKKGAQRLKLENIAIETSDATVNRNDFTDKFDKVLCDVPCSGLGVFGKKPDIIYKENTYDKEITSLQYDILCKSSNYVKKGGNIVYSTCTLNKKENEDVVFRFLESHKDFELMSCEGYIPERISCNIDRKCVTIFPQELCEGFFIAKFSRR